MAVATESSPLLAAEPRLARKSSLQPEPEPPLTVRQASSSSSSTSFSTSLSLSLDLGDALRDVIIGFSNGLMVPFALTAGLSSLGSSRLVIMSGLAELLSGMISMGLGAYLAAVTKRDRHRSAVVEDFCAVLCKRYGVTPRAARPLAEDLAANPPRCRRFVTDLAAGPDEPRGHAAWLSGLIMGLSYLVGGLVPMVPYFVLPRVDALAVSVAVTVVVLAFGYAKNYLAINDHRAGLWGALQTLVIGVLAAGTNYAIVRVLDFGAPA